MYKLKFTITVEDPRDITLDNLSNIADDVSEIGAVTSIDELVLRRPFQFRCEMKEEDLFTAGVQYADLRARLEADYGLSLTLPERPEITHAGSEVAER